ncbi:MAG: BamA/TamA family outer membrane protein [Kofleriaceae bacterium]
MIKSVALVAVVGASAFAQVAPGAQDSPAEDRDRQRASQPQEKTPPKTEPRPDPEPEPVAPNPPAPPVASPIEPLPLRPIAPTADDDVTTATFTSHPHTAIGWQLLNLPRTMIELVFLPIGLAAEAVDKYAIDTRVAEFFSFFDGWVSLQPRFKLSLSDGPGIGAWLGSDKLDSAHARVRVGGLVRLNGDWQAELEYQHALLLPGGRGLRAHVFVDRDKNRPYYGIGANTPVSNDRVIRTNQEGAGVDVDLHGVDRFSYSGVAGIGILRESLSTGSDNSTESLQDMDVVAAPPGYNETAVYATASIVERYDTRDSLGRPTRGTLLEASALARDEVTGKKLSAVTFGASAGKLFPVIAEHRAILVQVSGGAAIPLVSGDTIPYDALPQVGRINVRGYDKDRFVDKYAVVGTLEYRFPIYEYLASSAGLDAFVFADTGTLWGTSPFRDLPFHYSGGFGLRGASQDKLELALTLGLSPDGFQFSFGVEGL